MEIERIPSGYLVRHRDIILKFKNLYQEKTAVYAIVHVYRTLPQRRNLLITNLNLMATRSVSEVGRILEKQDEEPWSTLFPNLVAEIMTDFITPPEPAQLQPAENVSPEWLVEHLILKDAPTILFAPGGSGKSFLSLFIALCVQNSIDFFGNTEQAKVLYLDWEVDKAEAERRLGMIARGLSDIYEVTKYPSYLRMHIPLSDAIDSLLETTTEKGYRMLIIDSAACAVGGDMNDSSVVTKFFSAIRRVNACGITTLIISHVSKADKATEGRRSPVGSVHFENFPRLAWELRSDYDADKYEYVMGLFCRKSNVGNLKPIGLRMSFRNNAVEISPTGAEPLEAMGEKETTTKAIVAALAEKPMTPRELAKELDIKPTVVYSLLSRLRASGKVTQTGYGKWKAVRHDYEHDKVPF